MTHSIDSHGTVDVPRLLTVLILEIHAFERMEIIRPKRTSVVSRSRRRIQSTEFNTSIVCPLSLVLYHSKAVVSCFRQLRKVAISMIEYQIHRYPPQRFEIVEGVIIKRSHLILVHDTF
jgi:hypothetical protein